MLVFLFYIFLSLLLLLALSVALLIVYFNAYYDDFTPCSLSVVFVIIEFVVIIVCPVFTSAMLLYKPILPWCYNITDYTLLVCNLSAYLFTFIVAVSAVTNLVVVVAFVLFDILLLFIALVYSLISSTLLLSMVIVSYTIDTTPTPISVHVPSSLLLDV